MTAKPKMTLARRLIHIGLALLAAPFFVVLAIAAAWFLYILLTF